MELVEIASNDDFRAKEAVLDVLYFILMLLNASESLCSM
jgi:hypothetical protein